MFWNHGDCYGGNKTGNTNASTGAIGKPRYSGEETMTFTKQAKGYEKCMMMQNYRLILGMIDIDYRILVEWRVLGRPEGKLEDMLKHPRIQQILRNNIIWNKPNHMPSSVKDRFTSSYEPIFMLTKNNKPQYYYNTKTGLMADKKPKKLIEGVDWDWKDVEDSWQRPSRDETFKTPSRQKSTYATAKRKKVSYWKSVSYWFDLDAVRQPHTVCGVTDHRPMGVLRQKLYPGSAYNKSNDPHLKQFQHQKHLQIKKDGGLKKHASHNHPDHYHNSGKNPGDVWTIPTQPFPNAHFATFPEKLIEPMILSSCPQWICKKCGKARVRIVSGSSKQAFGLRQRDSQKGRIKGPQTKASRKEIDEYNEKTTFVGQGKQTIGWSDCGCNAGWVAGITFDPFIGSGTTGLVAKKLGRNYSGIELNPEYKKMADKRLMAIPDNLFK